MCPELPLEPLVALGMLLLMAAHVPDVGGRAATLAYLTDTVCCRRENPETRLVLLDDGLQHLPLVR